MLFWGGYSNRQAEASLLNQTDFANLDCLSAKEDITITASKTEKWLPGYSKMYQAGSISKFVNWWIVMLFVIAVGHWIQFVTPQYLLRC